MNDAQCNAFKSPTARFYESQAVRILLGSVFHPGGFKLTKELAQLTEINENSVVLDVASGVGSSAMFLTKEFNCKVVEIELSQKLVKEAKALSEKTPKKVFLLNGDAEKLPFKKETFDVAISECALCLFPCKKLALSEIFRVVKKGGKIAISDMIRKKDSKVRDENLSLITCIAGAESLESQKKKLEKVGFEDVIKLDRSLVLTELYEELKPKVAFLKPFIASFLEGCGCSDLNQLVRFTKGLEEAILSGDLGYGILIGKKPIW
jgi:arsenite methyltransferase